MKRLLRFLSPPILVSSGGLIFLEAIKEPDMPPSEGFTTALNNLLAAKDAEKAKAVSDATTPLQAKIDELQGKVDAAPTDTGPDVDAEDTKAIVDATPAPPVEDPAPAEEPAPVTE